MSSVNVQTCVIGGRHGGDAGRPAIDGAIRDPRAASLMREEGQQAGALAGWRLEIRHGGCNLGVELRQPLRLRDEVRRCRVLSEIGRRDDQAHVREPDLGRKREQLLDRFVADNHEKAEK